MAVSFKGAHCPQDIILMGSVGICLSAAYAPCRRAHARTWGARGSLDEQSVGEQVQPSARGSVSSPQAVWLDQLAHG